MLYSCTIWTLMRFWEKKLQGKYTRMLHTVLIKSQKQHPTKQQLYRHLPLISQIIQIRWARHAGHYWRSKNELISDIVPWTPPHGHTSVDWPAKTYIYQIWVEPGCSPEDLPNAKENRNGRWERIKELSAWLDDDDDIYSNIMKISINQGVFQKYQVWNCIYQDRYEQWM